MWEFIRNFKFSALLTLGLCSTSILVGCHPDEFDSGLEPELIDADLDGYNEDTDCNDYDPDIHPGADEVCDGEDNDCDGQVDEGCDDTTPDDTGDTTPDDTGDTTPDVPDNDGDGWDADHDCDDADGSVNPGMPEVCDGVDNDCDGDVDELESCGEDTDPGAAEDCNNGLDDDRDGLIDEADSDCSGNYDADGDGYCEAESSLDCYDGSQGGDCNDLDANINPGAQEIAGDTVDNNCDGLIDVDLDGDGELAIVHGGTDCDDNDATVNTSATEIIDGQDNNCDGSVDPVNITVTGSELEFYSWYQGGFAYAWEQLVLTNAEYSSTWEWVDINAIDIYGDWVGMTEYDEEGRPNSLADYGIELIELEAAGTGVNMLLNPAAVPIIEDLEGTNGHMYVWAFLQQAEADAGW